MKRLLAIILIVCSLFSFAAAEKDPAIGMWYFMYDFTEYPELKANFGEYDSLLAVLYFLEDGSILEYDNSITKSTPSQNCIACGKWEKDGELYKHRIVGIGEGTFTIDNDSMYITIAETGVKMLLHKIIPLNPYKDYRY